MAAILGFSNVKRLESFIPEVAIFIVVYRPLVSARSERRKDNAIGSAATNEMPRKCGLTHQARVQLCDAPVGICHRSV